MHRHTQALEPSNITDADIFTFALNLEYLEAEFFTWATTARLRALSIYCLNLTLP